MSKVKCGVKQVGDQYLNQKAQGQFCLYTMSVKNVGTEAQTFDASPQKAISPDGTKYDSDSVASMYANSNNNSFLTSINPGNEISGVVIVFDIPKGAKIATLDLHDSLFSGGAKVSVS